MAHDTKQGLMGLVTNVAETQAPPGTLIEAENVVVRRPGCVEPRDGFLLVQTLASGFAAYGFSWRAKDFILRNNGSNVFDWRDTAGSTYRYTDPVSGLLDPQPLRRDVFSRAEARANLYLPYQSGVLKMESDAGPWKTAGIPHAMRLEGVGLNFGVDASYGSWLPNNEQVGYRMLVRRKDLNLVEVVSIPNGLQVFANTTGVAVGVQLRINVSQLIDWDEVELYRTRNFPTSVTVDDEMQLVATIDKAAFGTVGFVYYIDYVDGVASVNGKVLYTSPSRGGTDQQNNRPPAAALTVLFRGSLFFANIRSPRRIVESFTFQGGTSGTISTAAGIGRRSYTGTQTITSNVLTALSSTTGLEKGMRVLIDGTYRTITAIAGATATFSGAAASATNTTARVFHDAIAIDGTWYELGLIGYVRPMPIFINYGLVSVIVSEQTPPEGGHQYTYIFETLLRDATAHTIQATHGSEYSPPLPNYDGTPEPLVQDTWPGAVAWSKPDAPEHVRPIDYEFVGDQNRAILGAIATRDALLLLKEDGVFRVTGANGDWRFDPIDPTAICVLPSSARSVRGRAMFLGDRGVVSIGEGGDTELVSAAVNDLLKPVVDQLVANWLSTGFYELPGMAGAAVSSVFERESEYTLARGSTVPPLVYNDITQAWTSLAYYGHANEAYAYKALFNFGRSGNCVLSLGVSYFKTLLSTDAGADYLRNDRATAVTVNSYAAPNATLSAAINALEDDVIKDSAGRYWRVTAAVNNSATVPVVLSGGLAAMATGAGTLYRSLRCSVIATGFTNPMASQKSWGEFLGTFTKFVGPVRARYGWQSSQAPAAFVEQDMPTSLVPLDLANPGTGFASYELGLAAPARVNFDNARAWLLRARIRWAQVHGDVQLEGISAAVFAMPENAKQQVKAA
jgi:hypothetical protein